jgi:hypothetical protein
MGETQKDEGIDAKSIFAGVFLAWLIALVMLFVVPGPREIFRGSKTFGWRKHVCVVENTALSKQIAHTPALLVTVRYEVDGWPYQATRCVSGDSRQELQERAGLFFQPGDKVDCRVNPDHHTEMMLDDEYVVFEFFLFAAIAITVICVIAVPLTVWWVRKDKAPGAARLQFLVRKVGMMFVCGFALVFGGTATITGFADAIRMLRSLGWPEAQATIEASSVTKVRKGKSWSYQLDLCYAYDFGGEQYKGTKWSLYDDTTTTRREIRKALGKLKKGDVVICYVNPGNPAQAVLDRCAWSFLLLPLLPMVLFLAAYGFWAALRERPFVTPIATSDPGTTRTASLPSDDDSPQGTETT